MRDGFPVSVGSGRPASGELAAEFVVTTGVVSIPLTEGRPLKQGEQQQQRHRNQQRKSGRDCLWRFAGEIPFPFVQDS